jgi:hypothetical protein
LQDRFRRSLYHAETLVLISGYAFGDDHLNETIFDAATHRERSEIIVFCFDTIPAKLAEQAAITPNIQVASPTEAIIGGIRAPWLAAEDAPTSIWADDKFLLGDFKHLAAYLAKSATTEHELMAATPVIAAATRSVSPAPPANNLNVKNAGA